MIYIIENEINEIESGTEYFAKYDNSYLEQYNDLFLLMYTYLYRHASIEGYVNLTIKDFLLYHNYTPNRTKRRINSKIYDTLNLMIKRGFIQYIGCYSNGGLATLENVDCDMMFTVQIINYDENWNPENRFTKILYSEIDRIRKSDIKFMGKALFLYVYIKKYITINDNEYATKISFPSESTLSKKSNCGISTVKKYIQSLCNIKMLYMKNYGSYLRMFKGKEIVVNSNNAYALDEKYLDSNGEEALKNYLKFNMGYIDGFFPFCDNLSDNNKNTDIDNDDWGEPNSMDTEEKDFTIEEILDMPLESDFVSESKESTVSEDKSVDTESVSINPIKVITIKNKKETKNREIPLDIKIQRYADVLYEQHGYGTDFEKSLFIAELSEKFPGLDDYEKFYNRAKKYYELGV